MVAPRRSSGSCRLWWPWGAVPDRKVRQGSQGSRQSCACRLPLLANRGLVEAKWPRVKSAPGCSGCRLLQLPPFGWSFVRPPLCWRSAAICFVFVGTVAPVQFRGLLVVPVAGAKSLGLGALSSRHWGGKCKLGSQVSAQKMTLGLIPEAMVTAAGHLTSACDVPIAAASVLKQTSRVRHCE